MEVRYGKHNTSLCPARSSAKYTAWLKSMASSNAHIAPMGA